MITVNTPQQLRWTEPWFFALRMRNRRGWQRRGWLIVAIFFAMMVGWYLEQQSSNGLRIGLTGATAMSLGIAVFLSFISDLGISEVQATDECIARATYGHDFGGSMWRYQDMTQVTFIPRGRSGKPFGLLILMMQANIVILGVPDQMPGSDVIKFFKHRGVREAQITVL